MILYSKVPQSGSTTMNVIFSAVSAKNFFKFHWGESWDILNKEVMGNRTLMENYISTFWKPPCPKMLGVHFRFIDFNKRFGKENPIYVSNVREPLARVRSRYYHNVGAKEKYKWTFEECLVNPNCSIGPCTTVVSLPCWF